MKTQALDDYRKEILIYSIQNQMVEKRSKPPQIPDILKE